MYGAQSQLEKELQEERLEEEAKYNMMIKELKEIGVKMNPAKQQRLIARTVNIEKRDKEYKNKKDKIKKRIHESALNGRNHYIEDFYSKTPNDKKVAKMLRAYFRSLGYKCYLGNMWFRGFSLIKYGLLIRW